MELEIAVTTRIGVPDGTTIEIAETGAVAGYRLPCGRLVRPWICHEIEEDDDNRDLAGDELTALGIEDQSEVERRIEEA